MGLSGPPRAFGIPKSAVTVKENDFLSFRHI